MKRSGQVALVLMGVTGATAAGAYMLPSRPECPAPQPAPVRDIMDLGKPAVQQGVAAPGAQQPCNRSSGSSSSRGGWHWYSHSNSYDRTASQNRPPNSTSVGFTSSNSSPHSSSGTSSSSSSSSSTARGGFGSTGHATSGGGHSGS
jgi:hypothetical protein